MIRVVFFLALVLGTTGCVSTLTPPRTVPPGKTRRYLLVGTNGRNSVTPRFMVRRGVSRRVDEGFQIGMLMGGADVKWNPVRGPVDLAWNPGAVGWLGPRLEDNERILGGSTSSLADGRFRPVAVLGAPLLLGFNFAPRISFIGVGGTGLVLEDGELPHALYRAGVGFNWRPRPRFALQVEFNGLYDVPRGAGAPPPGVILIGGVGLAFGRWSEYDDLLDGPGRP